MIGWREAWARRRTRARLRIWKLVDAPSPEPWTWAVSGPDGQWQGNTARTHAEALAVGLAALEAASVVHV